METHCLLEKLKESIKRDFQGRSLRNHDRYMTAYKLEQFVTGSSCRSGTGMN